MFFWLKRCGLILLVEVTLVEVEGLYAIASVGAWSCLCSLALSLTSHFAHAAVATWL